MIRVLAATILFFTFYPAEAHRVSAVSFDEVSSGVDAVVYARVVLKKGEFREYQRETLDKHGNPALEAFLGEAIWTRYQLHILRVIRGDISERNITLWRIGGTVGETTLQAGNALPLYENDLAIFALAKDHRTSSYYAPYGAQGVFLNVNLDTDDLIFIPLIDRPLYESSDDVARKSLQSSPETISKSGWVRPKEPTGYTLYQLIEVFSHDK